MRMVTIGVARIAQFVVMADGRIYTELVPFLQTIAYLSEDEKTITVYQRWINKFGSVTWQNTYVFNA
jgi:hypothetical protein